ncbi:MAG: multifunctional CCA tRNA nucleotidyl transferase/2'3'-cyclic phosphodiesterase/2'nucleotidase/phosphatase [Gammaproteobacteria bacterium RIFCSPHIGHO2_12_FULL_38_11]|nr:MAG: multifunctional CCA tRNA nucleotidyl transferase/2'3'-cyclic phosphodiesterase/2'nucleotidase/phosphatase [Gammaproteobacteria bacterium RIFCSPHIGHO2_12_FULL_38_11]
MEIYLVGGAVRDELLGKPVTERDWVVVGSSPADMIAKGYQPVGKDFPVFLHPKTHEEYALARTERKTGKGYKGFHFYATPDVSLADDLMRRDLTINAIAKNNITGELFDPYHGQADIRQKILRHVSPAFSEDPVRILRVARFASRFYDFKVHPETNTLMKQMVKSGEIDALVSERVWKELSRALVSEKPDRFFEVLKNCDALFVLFPEFKNNANLSALNNAVKMSHEGTVRFAALLSHLPQDKVKVICTRFRVPSEFTELAILVSKYHDVYHHLEVRNAEQLLFILKSIDAFRRPERFAQWVLACRAVYKNQNHELILLKALAATKNVDINALLEKNYQGKAFAEALHQLQLVQIKFSIP